MEEQEVTREQAEAAIDLACRYLRQQYVLYGIPVPMEDTPYQERAVEWAKALLSASQRDGWNGCELCRS